MLTKLYIFMLRWATQANMTDFNCHFLSTILPPSFSAFLLFFFICCQLYKIGKQYKTDSFWKHLSRTVLIRNNLMKKKMHHCQIPKSQKSNSCQFSMSFLHLSLFNLLYHIKIFFFKQKKSTFFKQSGNIKRFLISP